MSRPGALPRSHAAPARSSSTSKEPLHLPLHRRLLFPTYPPDKPLPALVPGDGAEIDKLNERIYHLIALALRAYVLSWLPRITRDRSLLPHIHAQIIAPILVPIFTHLSTHPEALIPLLLYDFPALLTLHWKTYWHARQTVHLLDGAIDAAYHAHLPRLCASPAPPPVGDPEIGRNVIPEGQYVVDGIWLTALADTISKNSLPTEEYKVVVQRSMVREILGRTILGSVARRIGEPWFWWGLLLRFLPAPRASIKVSQTDILSTIISVFWGVANIGMKAWTLAIWLGTTFTAAPPTRYIQTTDCWVELLREVLNVDGRLGVRHWGLRIVWGFFEAIVFLLSPLLDRLVPYLLEFYILTPSVGLRIVDLLERIVFPIDGYPAPTPPDPTPEEATTMRRLVEEQLGTIVPQSLRKVFVPEQQDLHAVLDPISDPGCNAHLIGMLYGAVIGTLVPDIVVSKPEFDGLVKHIA